MKTKEQMRYGSERGPSYGGRHYRVLPDGTKDYWCGDDSNGGWVSEFFNQNSFDEPNLPRDPPRERS